MADVNKSESKSEVKNFTVDPLTAMIPPGEEHHRCREALTHEGAGVNILGEDGLTPLMFAVNEDHAECVNELIRPGFQLRKQNIQKILETWNKYWKKSGNFVSPEKRDSSCFRFTCLKTKP